MNHNYVSISFPQQKVKLSDWETLQIKQAIDHQLAEIKKLTTRAVTVIRQGATPLAEDVLTSLQNLQCAHLPEGWYDFDLHYELEELFQYTQSSCEPVEAQDFLDELKVIFWCIDLAASDGAAIVQEVSAKLDKLFELADNGVCHAITDHWVIVSAETATL